MNAIPQPAELSRSTTRRRPLWRSDRLFGSPNHGRDHVFANVSLAEGGRTARSVSTGHGVLHAELQNDSFTCNYAGGKTVKEVFACDPTSRAICVGPRRSWPTGARQRVAPPVAMSPSATCAGGDHPQAVTGPSG
jgi:hypothetical protein